MFDAILVMKRDTLQESVLITRTPSTRRRDIILIPKYDETTNKIFRREKDDSDEEYVLILVLMGTISHGSNDWLVDTKNHSRICLSINNLTS